MILFFRKFKVELYVFLILNLVYNRELEADIKSDTSGHYRNVLISLLTASRPSGNTIDKTQARIDCDALIKAGVKKWGTDEAKFVTILCTRRLKF